ncbi:OsmC family protein [Psychroflexus planctonicus]|uniref:OsmC-like protein n=1 Tax=Psychroflexus planctonicus TaxID=1526575 RepID=A0ABQ1SBI0_9FLAO|nr:OsmC family protein [Psychroflexus planctonicus]GGE23535.1 OsmC-like protein [Psychroflexus planctonicus]
MQIKLQKKKNSDFEYVAENHLGHQIELCNSSMENPTSASPMELVLMAISGCSSIDIVHILKKQNLEIEDLQVETLGTRKETEPKVFTEINLLVKLKGKIPAKKALRAAQLSFEKYCSVSKMLDQTVNINYQVELNGNLIED